MCVWWLECVITHAGVCMKGTRLTGSAPLWVASRCWVAVAPLCINVSSWEREFTWSSNPNPSSLKCLSSSISIVLSVHLCALFLQEYIWDASHYLVQQVFSSLKEMFTGTREIQVHHDYSTHFTVTRMQLLVKRAAGHVWDMKPLTITCGGELFSGLSNLQSKLTPLATYSQNINIFYL